jgi:hypothetical protein
MSVLLHGKRDALADASTDERSVSRCFPIIQATPFRGNVTHRRVSLH